MRPCGPPRFFEIGSRVCGQRWQASERASQSLRSDISPTPDPRSQGYNMSATDCPICQDTITKAACGRCMHKFCYECLLTWCQQHHGCPTCRQDLEFIALDPTFDAIVDELLPADQRVSKCDDKKGDTTDGHSTGKLVINYGRGITSGVRIAVKSGPGVRITGIDRNGAFHAAGLRPGDIIYEYASHLCMRAPCAQANCTLV